MAPIPTPLPSMEPGAPYPLGASYDGSGTNFTVFSAHAVKVELCLFDAAGRHEIARYALPECTNEVWHGYLPDIHAGALYGYRVYGPYQPEDGHRFNPNKLLLDPYAKLLHGQVRWTDALYGYRLHSPKGDFSFDRRDRAPAMERGTFAALANPFVIDHLLKLGVTALELLPVHAVLQDRRLVANGLANYWGYNTLSFFAPEPRYLANNSKNEMRQAIRQLHAAGIEVILDVVYNHTCEESELGPTISFRGFDNASYYRLQAGNHRHLVNDTGCGNTLNLTHPRVLQLVMDSLRFWVQEFHVDGFRFDLGATLG